MSHLIEMNTLAKKPADWEIRYQYKSPYSQLFVAEHCTAAQAWNLFLALIPEEERGTSNSNWSLCPVDNYE